MCLAVDVELKRHIALEHGDELKLTRAQRREAMTIPLQFQYRDDTGGRGPVMSKEHAWHTYSDILQSWLPSHHAIVLHTPSLWMHDSLVEGVHLSAHTHTQVMMTTVQPQTTCTSEQR